LASAEGFEYLHKKYPPPLPEVPPKGPEKTLPGFWDRKTLIFLPSFSEGAPTNSNIYKKKKNPKDVIRALVENNRSPTLCSR
jgi:hypothetical protein